MHLASLLLALLLACLPRTVLVRRLERHGPAGLRLVPAFSGRTALALVAQADDVVQRRVLLPAYLCNVVPMAFERHGWQLSTYATDAAFGADGPALLAQALRDRASCLLVAPLYGGDGGLRWWVSPEASALRRQHGIALVLDLCQDAAWLSEIPPGLERCAVLVSFNDKSFPGAMGAALWTDLPVPVPPTPGWPVLRALLAWRLLTLASHWLRGRNAVAAEADVGHEFSHARELPYDFGVAGACRWQLALGALGLAWLPRWQARRRAAVARGSVRPVAPSIGRASPFVLVGDDDPGLHQAKAPYAMHGDAARSLRPALRIRHNKGFADR